MVTHISAHNLLRPRVGLAMRLEVLMSVQPLRQLLEEAVVCGVARSQALVVEDRDYT